jgi:L-ribulose-5-phosphate 4-epimerase
MLLESLRREVLHANQEIARRGLAPHTFGNASGIDRLGADGSGREPLVVIKPSGVDYAALTPADLVVTNLAGKIVEGTLRPSSDLDTHTLLYREFPMIGGIVHTHSEFATSWAQACRPIPCLGTTHADYFHGPVPVTEPLTAEEVAEAYVRNTGAVIVRRFQREHLDPIAVPGVLVAGHAPFAWGRSPTEAVKHADVLEYIARLAWRSILLEASEAGIPAYVSEHHYQRKHGPRATYGQPKSSGSGS